jgi:pre-mRNA-splicing factor ISY1
MNKKQRIKVRSSLPYHFSFIRLTLTADWEEACLNLRETLGLPEDTPTPKIPRPTATTQVVESNSNRPPPPSSKRKAASQSEDVAMDSVTVDDSKKAKTVPDGTTGKTVAEPPAADASRLHAQAAAAYIPFLDVEHLLPPKLPTHSEMEGVLLALRKKALVEEYFGDAT